VIHTTTIKPGETITTEPNGAGVRITIKTRMFTAIRELDCNQAAALLFGLEMALEHSACERLRTETVG
jgi:hypothetical protein